MRNPCSASGPKCAVFVHAAGDRRLAPDHDGPGRADSCRPRAEDGPGSPDPFPSRLCCPPGTVACCGPAPPLQGWDFTRQPYPRRCRGLFYFAPLGLQANSDIPSYLRSSVFICGFIPSTGRVHLRFHSFHRGVHLWFHPRLKLPIPQNACNSALAVYNHCQAAVCVRCK